MPRILIITLMAAVTLLAGWNPLGSSKCPAPALNPNPPASPVRLVFIHHSVGEDLLNRGLFAHLNANNYYVTDTYCGWPGDYDIGSLTDIGH